MPICECSWSLHSPALRGVNVYTPHKDVRAHMRFCLCLQVLLDRGVQEDHILFLCLIAAPNGIHMVCALACARVHVRACACMRAFAYVCVSVCMCVCARACLCAFAYVCVPVCVRVLHLQCDGAASCHCQH